MAVVEFDAVDALPPAAAAKLTHLRELADDRHGSAMGARERLETVRENRNRLQATINSVSNNHGYVDTGQLAKLQTDLKQLDAKLRAGNDAYSERSARWTAINHVVQRIEAYIGDLPTTVAIEPFAGPVPKLKGAPADAIASCRARVEEIRAEVIAVQTAPLPSSDQLKRALAQIDEVAARGEPTFQPTGEIEWPMMDLYMRVSGALAAVNGEIIDAQALVVWLHRDALRKKVAALITEQADDKAAIAPAERPKRLAALRADLLAVERLECAAVEAANTDDYRATCDPRAVLNLSDDLPRARDEV